MRSIAPTISKAEIVAVSVHAKQSRFLLLLPMKCYLNAADLFYFFQLCRRYPGFVRVCLSEPQPERR